MEDEYNKCEKEVTKENNKDIGTILRSDDKLIENKNGFVIVTPSCVGDLVKYAMENYKR